MNIDAINTDLRFFLYSHMLYIPVIALRSIIYTQCNGVDIIRSLIGGYHYFLHKIANAYCDHSLAVCRE